MNGPIPNLDPSVGFCCDRLPEGPGWTYTLTTLLGSMLWELEQIYGPRDREWTPLGVEFGGTRPCIWYPGNRGHVSIKLSFSASMNISYAVFELAHEAVHLLSPSGKRSAPAIEEGLATIYAIEKSQQLGIKAPGISSSYFHCMHITRNFISHFGPSSISRIRQQEPAFYKWQPHNLRSVFPELSENDARDLCEPFAAIEERLQTPSPANMAGSQQGGGL